MWMQRFGRQLGALALLALLVRALVPAGYMVAEAGTAEGRYLVVQMCDGHTGAAQAIDLDTGKVVDPSKSPDTSGGQADTPCVFAMAAVVSLPPLAAKPVLLRHAVPVELKSVSDVQPGRGIAAPPPPATGPPSLI